MEYRRLPVADLEFDIQNPRVARIVEMYGEGGITPDRMELALSVSPSDDSEGGATFYSLRESIKTNGGVIHPIIVNQTGDGSLVVIEGNTRTLIYKQFMADGLSGDWDTIPAIVHTQLTQAEIDAIRLQAHLVGPRQWDPYSKAKYLNHLRNSEHLPFSQIVDFCGGKEQEISRYIDAYKDMERFYRPVLASDDEFDPTRFSAFVELQRGSVTEAIAHAGYTKTDFSTWVTDGRLKPLALVRTLPRILRSPDATHKFLTDGAQEAVKLLDAPRPEESLSHINLSQLLSAVKRRIWEMPYSTLRQLKEQVGSPEVENILETRDALDQLCQDIASDD